MQSKLITNSNILKNDKRGKYDHPYGVEANQPKPFCIVC